MTLRIKLPTATREEINRSDQFSELRDAISAADGSGNAEVLARLQAEYRTSVRAFREANQGRSPSASTQAATGTQPVAAMASTGEVPPTLTDDESMRAVYAYLCTWDTWMKSEHEGEDCWFRFRPGAFDEYLRRGAAVALSVNHLDEVSNLGSWRWFQADYYGQRALAVFDDVPGAWEAMDALDDGRAAGFSVYARPTRVVEHAQRRDGLRAFDVEAALLVEAGPVDSPAHRGAIALDIAGHQPRWQVEQEAIERNEQVRRMWGLS